jgi:signal transduction histidine kinase
LRTLTERLLLLASQQELPRDQIDIETAVADAVTHVVPLAQSKHIEIDSRVGALTVEGHLESIVEILEILLDNAIKYSPKKSHIVLQSKRSPHTVEISVADEGPGIPPEEHEKIFERFYRSDMSRSKENVEGHGLGLSLAKRLADQMHGSLTLKSDGKKGTVFILSLPR